MGSTLLPQLERDDIDLHDGGAPCIDCEEAATDGSVKLIRIADPFTMSAERAGDIGEAPLLVLISGTKLGQEGVGPLCLPVRIDSLNRCLYRLPAAVIENDGQNRQPILLRHGVHLSLIHI